MDLKTIIYFKKVAELQHVTKAAQELYISQAQLSRIIADLEAELGVPLFDRAKRGISLNSCGQLYYQYVLKILNLIEEGQRSVLEEYSRKQAQLIIATNAGAYMPTLISLVRQKDPGMRIKQYSLPKKKLISLLHEEVVSFGVLCPPVENDAFESITLLKERAVIIYPQGHWLENHKKISLSALSKEPMIGVSRGYGARDATEIMYRTHSFTPNFIIETGDSSTMARYVTAGLGISVVPKSLFIQEDYFKDHYVEFEEDIYGTLELVWNRNHKFSQSEQLFYDTALDYFRELAESIFEPAYSLAPSAKDIN